MKTLFLLLMAISFNCFALTISDIAGVYKGKLKSVPLPAIYLTLSIDKDGSTTFSDEFGNGCYGVSTIIDEVTLISEVTCNMSVNLTFTTDLSKRNNPDHFEATVKSAYTGTAVWEFNRQR